MQEIICVLDRSGSMQSVASDAVGGFNAFVKAQKEVPIPANIMIAWFDDAYTITYEGAISGAPMVAAWPHGGMTALYDAIGKTIKHVGERFSKEHPEKVILAILTDGQENASKEFTRKAVFDLIAEHREKYGWEVVFLAADQDACLAGQAIGVAAGNTYSYSSMDTASGFATYSSAVTRARL